MGNTLPAPKRDKESAEGSFGPKFGFALSDMQGWRLTMEDAYIVDPNFVPDEKETHLVGVFDGHGGSEVAKFCSNHFAKHLWQLQSYKQGNYALALKECFHLMDVLLQKEENFEEIVNYRAQTLTDQFNILCDIIINKRTNKFTLNQLQDLLDQANFFSVPLTIKPELITALEELTAKQKAAQEAQKKADAKLKAKQKTKKLKPRKPKKPKAPKEPKAKSDAKGSRLVRMFTRTKRGDKKKTNHRLKSIESDWSDEEEDRTSKEKTEKVKKDKALLEAEAEAEKRLKERKDKTLKKKKSNNALFMMDDDIEPPKRGEKADSKGKTNPFASGKPKLILGAEPVPNNRTFPDIQSGSEPPGLKSMGSQPPGLSSMKSEPPGLKSGFSSMGTAPPGFGSMASLPPGMEKPAPPNVAVESSDKPPSEKKEDDEVSVDPFADDPIEVNAEGQIVVVRENQKIALDDKEHSSVAEIQTPKIYKLEKKKIMRSIRLTNSNKGRKLKTHVFSHSQMSMNSDFTLEDLENGAYSPEQGEEEEKDDLDLVRRKKRVKKRVKRSRTKVEGEEDVDAEEEIEDATPEPEVVPEEKPTKVEETKPPTEAMKTEVPPQKEPEKPAETAKKLPEGQFITSAGCTAITALFRGTKIYVANIGDSRAVMSRAGKAFPLSEDHKPTAPKEKARIYAAGGIINAQGRINGDLNLSRCVGDLRFKTQKHLSPAEQIITAEADVETFDICAEDQFIVFACDGVWDVMTSQEVISFVLHKIVSGEKDLKKVAEHLLDNCLSEDLVATKGLGGDNMTCVIIRLQPMTDIKRFKMKKKMKKQVRKRLMSAPKDKRI